MSALGHKTIAGSDRCEHRSQFFERYGDRCPAALADEMLMIRLLREVVDPGPMAQMNVMKVAQLLQHIERAVDR